MTKNSFLKVEEINGDDYLELELPIILENDKSISEIMRIIRPLLKEKKYTVMEISKQGKLEYVAMLLHGNKPRNYKITKTGFDEIKVEKTFLITNNKIVEEKKNIRDKTYSELIEIKNKKEIIARKDSMNSTDLFYLELSEISEDELLSRKKKLMKTMEEIKLPEKETKAILFSLDNM